MGRLRHGIDRFNQNRWVYSESLSEDSLRSVCSYLARSNG
jgi:hypothetical protein